MRPENSTADSDSASTRYSAPRAELLHVLMLPDLDRVGAIQTYWGNPAAREFGELPIDDEETGRCGRCS
jgi:hypothetical protein